jgi:hypothetical protein
MIENEKDYARSQAIFLKNQQKIINLSKNLDCAVSQDKVAVLIDLNSIIAYDMKLWKDAQSS